MIDTYRGACWFLASNTEYESEVKPFLPICRCSSLGAGSPKSKVFSLGVMVKVDGSFYLGCQTPHYHLDNFWPEAKPSHAQTSHSFPFRMSGDAVLL